ncbi:MAG: hypothetical protein RLN74_13195, partial [Ilumatobacter fluminis]
MAYSPERTRHLIEQRDRHRRLMLGLHDRWSERLTLNAGELPLFPSEAERELRTIADDALDDATVDHLETRIKYRRTRDLRSFMRHTITTPWGDGEDSLHDALGTMNDNDWSAQPPDADRIYRFMYSTLLADLV